MNAAEMNKMLEMSATIAAQSKEIAELKAALASKCSGKCHTDKPVKPAKPEIVVTDDMKAKVFAAARADKKVDGKYTSYSGFFVIMSGLKKYGDGATFKDSTIIQAARDYGIISIK